MKSDCVCVYWGYEDRRAQVFGEIWSQACREMQAFRGRSYNNNNNNAQETRESWCMWMLPLLHRSPFSPCTLSLRWLSITLTVIRLGHVIWVICLLGGGGYTCIWTLQVCATSTPSNDEGYLKTIFFQLPFPSVFPQCKPYERGGESDKSLSFQFFFLLLHLHDITSSQLSCSPPLAGCQREMAAMWSCADHWQLLTRPVELIKAFVVKKINSSTFKSNAQ